MISIVKPLYCFIVSELRLEGMVNALEEIRFSIGERRGSINCLTILAEEKKLKSNLRDEFRGTTKTPSSTRALCKCEILL